MTSVVTASARGDAQSAGKDLAEQLVSKLGGETPALVFVFASTQQPLDVLLPPIIERFAGATVLSASTAGEFTEETVSKGAAVAVAIAGDYEIRAGMADGLAANAEAAIAEALGNVPESLDGYAYRTGVMLLDPLSGNGEEATLLAASMMATESSIRLVGGAAGDDLAMKATHVGMGSRVASDAIIVAAIFSKKPLGIGVCHGHEALNDERMTVTKSDGATVFELDGRPAWEVWKERTREVAAAVGINVDAIPADELGGFLLRYQAGLASGSELKLRAPLSLGEDGSLSFASGIPQGSVIRLTKSTPQRQVHSAVKAAERACEQLESEPAGAVVFDCICRNLILAEKFDDAVSRISKALGGTPLAGFETYGEIALDVGDMSGFHNSTTVVLAFPS